MSASATRLANAPIVEAVLDIDYDMPPSQEIAALETRASDSFRDQYPKFRTQYLQEHRIEQPADGPPRFSARRGIQAFQFLTEDEKQIVQVRAQGFSFNRLAPYTSLDDYLPEIERTWRLFVGLASPIQVRRIRLRYINRILLPMVAGQVELNDYLTIGPKLPDEERLTFVGFLNQQRAIEKDTGNEVTIMLATQAEEQDRLPIIFDIAASRADPAEPDNWDKLLSQIHSLRSLKNRVFRDTLTDRCLELFR